MEAQQCFFSNACKSKDFIKSCLFLFKIAVSIQCMFFVFVTLHARLNDLSQHMNKTEESDSFFEEEHKHENPVSLDIDTSTSLLHVTPINMLSRSKAPKTQQIEQCQHPRKASVFF